MTAFANAVGALHSPQEIEEIAQSVDRDPLAASTEILGDYYEMSVALGRLLHADEPPVDATFATFAAWSVQSLRVDIRVDNDDESDRGSRADRVRRPGRWLYDVATEALMTDRDAIARNIAAGQAAVYGEVGVALWLLLTVTAEKLDRGLTIGDQAWERFTDDLLAYWQGFDTSGRRRTTARSLADQDLDALQQAVAPYFQVLQEKGVSAGATPSAAKRRAELVLLGNIRLVAYEQKRLQPILVRNLALLPQALRLRIVTEWFGRNNLATRAATRAYQIAAPLVPLVEEAFQIAATRHVYRLLVGHEQLRFGADLPLPPPAHPLLRQDQSEADQDRYAEGVRFPYHLQTLEHPPLWSEWKQYDRSFGQGERTAVDNWLRFPERLNFIVNLFRSRQQMSALYERPSATPLRAPARPVLGPVQRLPALDMAEVLPELVQPKAKRGLGSA